MTLVVSRDTDGNVSIDYSADGTRVSLASPAANVAFTDNYAAKDAPAPEVIKDDAVEPAVAPAAPGGADSSGGDPSPAAPADGEADVEHAAFNCPACGAEFDEQVTCTNQHPPEPTLATAAVIAGAAPQDPTDVSEPSPPASPEASSAGDGSSSDGASESAASSSADAPAFPGQ